MAERPQRTNSWRDSFGSGVVYSVGLVVGFLLVTTTGCYEKHLAPQIEYAPSEVDLLREEIQKMEWD